LLDDADARKFGRAGSEYRTTFYRGFYALEVTRKRKDTDARSAERSNSRPPSAAARNDRINAQASRRMSAREPSEGLSDVTEVVVEETVEAGRTEKACEFRNEPTLAPEAAEPQPFPPCEGGTQGGSSLPTPRSGVSDPPNPPFARGGADGGPPRPA